jgi:hypothetical protein
MAEEDPFEPPPELAPKKDHRPVYVGGRFVRLEKPKPGSPVELLQEREKDKVPKWVEKVQELREAKPKKPTPPLAAKGPRQLHTPEFGGKPEPPVDRRPPRIETPKDRSTTGRMRARPTRTTTAHGGPPLTEDGQLDRRPPRIGDRPRAQAPSQARPRPPPAVDEEGNPIDRRPPRVDYVPKDERGEPLRAWRDRRRAMETGIPLEPLPEPAPPPAAPPEAPVQPVEKAPVVESVQPTVAQSPEEPAPPPEEPPPPPPPPASSMDDFFASPPPRHTPKGGMEDLFGGMQEGRVRMSRRKKKLAQAEPEPEPEEEKPAEEIDRTPPKLDVDPSKLPKE